jgi:5-methyltetrahydrofolate--homocysteine methyltransferase
MNETYKKLIEAIEFGDEDEAAVLAQQAIDEGNDPSAIINEAMAEGVRRAGVRFNEGEFFLPELMLAGEAMNAGLDVVMPVIEASMTKLETKGKIMMGSVEGDVHDIGKNICISLLQSQGYEVIDLGVDNEEAWIVEQVQKEKPDILGLGSYMTTTMVHIPPTFERLRSKGLTDNMKLLAGGAAINERWALDVAKADGYAEDAWGMVDLVNEMLDVEVEAGSLGYGRDSDRTKIV